MAFVTLLGVILFVSIMIVSFTIHHGQDYEDKNKQEQERDHNINKGKQIETHVSDSDHTPSQSSSVTEASQRDDPLNQLPENLATEVQQPSDRITIEQLTEMVLSRMVFQSNLVPSSLTESQAADLKIGLKIACLVIGISTTGLLSVFTGFSGDQTSASSKILFKACMLSMFISFLSGVILLILSITRPNFQYLILTAKIVMWVAIGLVTLVVTLVLVSYFQRA